MKTLLTTLSLIVFAAGLAGCGPQKLRYEPDPFIKSAKLLSADYTELADKLKVEVNTDGFRIDQVWVAVAGGGDVKPTQIEYDKGGGGGVGFGVGVGGGGGGVGVGAGANTGRGENIQRVYLYFDKAAVGPAPWSLQIKLMSMPRTTIVLGERDG